ncbi:MAG: hypothetical protein IT442_12805 [Phycisphaeraceae bacterium]|nr:hypothetical protein [Phycisphaeraceae bacterium]
MQRLACVILRHTSSRGCHHDWLFEQPVVSGTAPLWAARSSLAPQAWATVGRWMMEALPPHRRRYLSYQGPLSRQRGRVVRVDEGWCLGRLWTPHRILLDVRLRRFTGLVELERLTSERWSARVLPRG